MNIKPRGRAGRQAPAGPGRGRGRRAARKRCCSTTREWDGYRENLVRARRRCRSPDRSRTATGIMATENPQVGATEIWEIANLTEDAHPIHLHLVQFQLINRAGDGRGRRWRRHDLSRRLGCRLPGRHVQRRDLRPGHVHSRATARPAPTARRIPTARSEATCRSAARST